MLQMSKWEREWRITSISKANAFKTMLQTKESYTHLMIGLEMSENSTLNIYRINKLAAHLQNASK